MFKLITPLAAVALLATGDRVLAQPRSQTFRPPAQFKPLPKPVVPFKPVFFPPVFPKPPVYFPPFVAPRPVFFPPVYFPPKPIYRFPFFPGFYPWFGW